MTNVFNRRNVVLLGGAGLVLAGIAGLTVLNPSETSTKNALEPSLGAGLEQVMLVDGAGAPVRWGDLEGQPRALFFGFTHCPVICPVTVYELTAAMDKIGAPAANLAIHFVTIDPERDTPERLREYFSGFGPRVHGYSGTPEAIAQIAGGYEVVYRRTALEGGDYTMEHTATVFLIDATGAMVDVIGYGSPPEVVEQRLRTLVVGTG